MKNSLDTEKGENSEGDGFCYDAEQSANCTCPFGAQS